MILFTPGIRWNIPLHTRVSLYPAIGVGIGSFGKNESQLGPEFTSSTIGRTESWALQFGGGIDFRLTRLLSLRFEAGDFVTRARLGVTDGRNHPIYSGGIGLHF
ncbi:MAG TPA: hypothetical protein VE959_21430 [Bryobacteraceae bacterium]|nr:hypothetical protein [Bryobacteraceae bacterium]